MPTKNRYLLSLLCLLCALAAGPASAHGGHDDVAQRAAPKKAEARDNPRADFWRQVRESLPGYTAVQGRETEVLIQNGGQNWRQLRNGPLALLGGVGLIGTALALAGFYAWRGPVKLSQARSGRQILRWQPIERAVHWITAAAFIVLAGTGLALLFGRAIIIPWLGHEYFAYLATAAKWLHNTLGPFIFLPGLLSMFGLWAKDNLPNRLDLAWFKAYGGMVGHRHPSAGRMNGGEKAWFWLLVLSGTALCVSGLILDFPNFEQVRATLQIAHLVHVLCAVALMCAALGHIYIGSIGSEGALEGMQTGYVDESWARQHHDLWLDEVRRPASAPLHAASVIRQV